MVDWENGKPNPRFRVFHLLKENFGPGHKIAESSLNSSNVYALAVVTPSSKHRVLLVNKRQDPTTIEIPGAAVAQIEYVDTTTDGQAWASAPMESDNVKLGGFTVAVITFP